jgi:hypothetical protein
LNIQLCFVLFLLTLCSALEHWSYVFIFDTLQFTWHSIVFFFFWILWWLVIAHDIPNSFWHFVTTTQDMTMEQIFSCANLHLPFQEYMYVIMSHE